VFVCVCVCVCAFVDCSVFENRRFLFAPSVLLYIFLILR